MNIKKFYTSQISPLPAATYPKMPRNYDDIPLNHNIQLFKYPMFFSFKKLPSSCYKTSSRDINHPKLQYMIMQVWLKKLFLHQSHKLSLTHLEAEPLETGLLVAMFQTAITADIEINTLLHGQK